MTWEGDFGEGFAGAGGFFAFFLVIGESIEVSSVSDGHHREGVDRVRDIKDLVGCFVVEPGHFVSDEIERYCLEEEVFHGRTGVVLVMAIGLVVAAKGGDSAGEDEEVGVFGPGVACGEEGG